MSPKRQIIQPDTFPSNAAIASASPMRMAELGWAAGFIDGEGYVGIAVQRYPNRLNPTYRPKLVVGQNHRESLERLREILDIPGKVYALKRRSFQNRQYYVLPYDGQKAIDAMTLVEPFLVRKGPEVALCKQFWIDGKHALYPAPPEIWAIREKYYNRLRRMK